MASRTGDHIEKVVSFLKEPSLPKADVVGSSWLRSANTHHVDLASQRKPLIMTCAEIRKLQEPSARALAIAQVELDHLYRLVRPAHYVVLYCSPAGVVIDHRGEQGEAREFQYWGTWLGANWAEDIEGTNGIGTAIVESRAVTVHRSQHFRARHMNLSCSGAPVFAPDGTLAALLDVSSIDPLLSEHAHALTGAITISAARCIEERLFRDAYRRCWVLAVRCPNEFGAAMLFAADTDRRIVGADRKGRAYLARSEIRLDRSGVDLGAVFEDGAMLSRIRSRDEDTWTNVQPLESDAMWPAVITGPEPNVIHTSSPESDEFRLRPRLDMLLNARWPSQAIPRVTGGLTPAMVRRVRAYIDANLDKPLELETLAAQAGLSRFHFTRAFKQSEGVTPHDYVLDRRLARAQELLQGSALSLSQIAIAVGFSDQSHFTRRFRASVGVSPGKFRRLHR